MATEQELMTISEVADFFRVRPNTIWRWRRDGVLPSVRVGKAVRFRREDIDQMIKAKVEANAE